MLVIVLLLVRSEGHQFLLPPCPCGCHFPIQVSGLLNTAVRSAREPKGSSSSSPTPYPGSIWACTTNPSETKCCWLPSVPEPYYQRPY